MIVGEEVMSVRSFRSFGATARRMDRASRCMAPARVAAAGAPAGHRAGGAPAVQRRTPEEVLLLIHNSSLARNFNAVYLRYTSVMVHGPGTTERDTIGQALIGSTEFLARLRLRITVRQLRVRSISESQRIPFSLG